MKVMELKELLLLICIVGGFMVLTYSIKHTCKQFLERLKNDDK